MIFTGDTIFSLSLIDQNPCGFDTPSTRESVPIPPPQFHHQLKGNSGPHLLIEGSYYETLLPATLF